MRQNKKKKSYQEQKEGFQLFKDQTINKASEIVNLLSDQLAVSHSKLNYYQTQFLMLQDKQSKYKQQTSSHIQKLQNTLTSMEQENKLLHKQLQNQIRLNQDYQKIKQRYQKSIFQKNKISKQHDFEKEMKLSCKKQLQNCKLQYESIVDQNNYILQKMKQLQRENQVLARGIKKQTQNTQFLKKQKFQLIQAITQQFHQLEIQYKRIFKQKELWQQKFVNCQLKIRQKQEVNESLLERLDKLNTQKHLNITQIMTLQQYIQRLLKQNSSLMALYEQKDKQQSKIPFEVKPFDEYSTIKQSEHKYPQWLHQLVQGAYSQLQQNKQLQGQQATLRFKLQYFVYITLKNLQELGNIIFKINQFTLAKQKTKWSRTKNKSFFLDRAKQIGQEIIHHFQSQ